MTFSLGCIDGVIIEGFRRLPMAGIYYEQTDRQSDEGLGFF